MSGMAQGHKYTKTYEAEQIIELEVFVWIPELVACWSEVGVAWESLNLQLVPGVRALILGTVLLTWGWCLSQLVSARIILPYCSWCQKMCDLLGWLRLTETCDFRRTRRKGKGWGSFDSWMATGSPMVWNSSCAMISYWRWKLPMELKMMDPSPGMLAHWMHKKMQNNKKTLKNTIPWLLLTIIAKMKERWAKLRFWPVQTTDSRLRALAEGVYWGRSIATSLRAIS